MEYFFIQIVNCDSENTERIISLANYLSQKSMVSVLICERHKLRVSYNYPAKQHNFIQLLNYCILQCVTLCCESSCNCYFHNNTFQIDASNDAHRDNYHPNLQLPSTLLNGKWTAFPLSFYILAKHSTTHATFTHAIIHWWQRLPCERLTAHQQRHSATVIVLVYSPHSHSVLFGGSGRLFS